MLRPIAIGVDVGGTYAKLSAVTPRGLVLAEAAIDTEPESGPALFVERVAAHLGTWLGEEGLKPAALGLGLAGDVDSEKGTMRFAPNLRGWAGFGFKAAFSRKLKVPVVVDNDANMAVWGGYCLRLKRGPRHVVGITLGTGVGGGLILDGRLHRGATGSAGEVGHAVVVPGGELCHCGTRGCLEAYAGSYGILRTAGRIMGKSRAAGLEPADLARAADAGDAAARRVWRETAEHLAVGISNLILVLNPEVVLLLGGVSKAGRWLMHPLAEAMARSPFTTPLGAARVVSAAERNWGSIGAALLAAEALRARR